MYKPLPDSLTIKTSKVNGLGLFANKFIAQGINLGISHYEMKDIVIRTPLGGFINHSNNPNCARIELQSTNGHSGQYEYKKWNLVTVQDITKGKELTLKYKLYDV